MPRPLNTDTTPVHDLLAHHPDLAELACVGVMLAQAVMG